MILIIFLYLSIAIAYMMHCFIREFISPGLIFVAAQCLMFVGIVSKADLMNAADKKLIYIYCIAMLCFVVGNLLLSKHRDMREIYIERAELKQFQIERIWLVIIVGTILTILFFARSGTNIILMALDSATYTKSEYVNARLSNYKVIGVGYIFQFRVILVPLLVTYCCYATKGWQRVIAMTLMPITILNILGTGQRGGFFVFSITVLVSFLYMIRFADNNTSRRTMLLLILFSILAISLFSIVTIINGRAAGFGDVTSAIIKRLISDNQSCAIVAFRYIDGQETQWGYDWIMMLKDLLPGKNSYTSLATRIFSIMYGGTRGTAPECLWGSVYYNWGYLGIIVFPFILGMMYRAVYDRFLSYPLTTLRVFIYSNIFVVIGLWIASGPIHLCNQGLLSLGILAFILHIDSSVKQIEEDQPNLNKYIRYYNSNAIN